MYPSILPSFRSSICLLISLFLLGPALGAPVADFDFRRDTFAFANETFFAYEGAASGNFHFHLRQGQPPAYSRRCFVLTRAVVQFHRFAAFRPDLPRCTDGEYRAIVRSISKIPVWSGGNRKPTVIPGYKDLAEFSQAKPALLQEELGNWWPTFFRPGNWRLVFPTPRDGQARLAEWLVNQLQQNRLRVVYITRFRPLNHCLVVYDHVVKPNGDIDFAAYDPNQPGKAALLHYRAAPRSFYFDRTWYFPGGLVNVLRVYLSPFL